MNQTLYHMNEGANFFPDNPDFTHDSRIELIESKARFDSFPCMNNKYHSSGISL